MSTLFLILIYAAFVSLGLPDSLLGTAWPMMQIDFGVSTDSAGEVYMVIAGMTILSSMISSRLIRRFGTGLVVLCSVFLTAAALLSMSFVSVFWKMLIFAIPLGLGAGAIDSALNEFVAEHYSSKQMSWLHCFWGIGATGGPIILAALFRQGITWRNGYQIISIVQFALMVVLIFSLPYWKRFTGQPGSTKSVEAAAQSGKSLSLIEALRVKGALQAMFSFFCYCAAEQGLGLWGATYLIKTRNVSASTAAAWISGYYFAITLGRFINGLLTSRFSNRTLIRVGQIAMITGCLIMLLPLNSIFSLAGIIVFGLGCAPVYPSMLQETPVRFGKVYAQDIMGFQMGVAYMGSTFMPPLLGKICTAFSMTWLPYFLLFFAVVLFLLSEKLNRTVYGKESVIE